MENNKIKLCVITTISLTLKTFLIDQLVYLSNNGFEITVICNPDSDFEKQCPKELKYIPVGMTRDLGVISSISGLFRLYLIFRNEKFDIIQFSTPKAAFLSALVGFLAGIKNRLYCQWGIRYVGFHGLHRFIFKQFEKITCLLSTHVSPDSKGNLEFAVSEGLYPDTKASVVYNGSANGVNLTKFDKGKKIEWRNEVLKELKLPNDAFVFGFLGRLTKDKGVNELIDSFLSFEKDAINVYLLLVGPLEKNNNLDSYILRNIDQHRKIISVGEKANPQLYLAAMDVLVLPSYREGFGIVALEAQALEVPVIATDIPGPREAIIPGKTGMLVPVKNVQSLSEKMQKMMSSPNDTREMGIAGYKYVYENFEQKTFWRKVLEHRKLFIKENS